MTEESKNSQKPSSGSKRSRKSSKSIEPKVEKKKAPVVTYSYWAYCNIIGASDAVHFVAKMKFKNYGKKTIDEWRSLFKKEEIV
jgi:hypothetical protein